MDKLISQQAAINAVSEITTTMSVCTNKDECCGMKRMQKQAITELENLPSAEPEHPDINVGNIDDCISRKAAIGCLNNVSFDCSMDQEVVEEELLKLPPVQPEQRWVPCSERLPEKSGYYLATVDIGMKIVDVIFFNNGSGFLTANTVKAWKPTPEPYQEGGK